MAFHEETLRKELKALLRGDQAHATLERAVEKFPADKRGTVPAGLEHSGWQLLEHIRIAQHDILAWANNSDGSYKEKKWPDDYWPKDAEPPSDKAWSESLHACQQDREKLEKLAEEGDLTAPFAWDKKHNLLRQIMMAADHTSYHVGEIVFLRRALGCWE